MTPALEGAESLPLDCQGIPRSGLDTDREKLLSDGGGFRESETNRWTQMRSVTV